LLAIELNTYEYINLLSLHFDVRVNSSGPQKNCWIARGFAQEYLRSG